MDNRTEQMNYEHVMGFLFSEHPVDKYFMTASQWAQYQGVFRKYIENPKNIKNLKLYRDKTDLMKNRIGKAIDHKLKQYKSCTDTVELDVLLDHKLKLQSCFSKDELYDLIVEIIDAYKLIKY
jgi:hypothetical protein